MKELAEKKREFNTEERNLLSVAYKNVVGAKRTAWRVLSAIERKEENSTEKTDLIKEYRQKIEKELEDICDEVVVSDFTVWKFHSMITLAIYSVGGVVLVSTCNMWYAIKSGSPTCVP